MVHTILQSFSRYDGEKHFRGPSYFNKPSQRRSQIFCHWHKKDSTFCHTQIKIGSLKKCTKKISRIKFWKKKKMADLKFCWSWEEKLKQGPCAQYHGHVPGFPLAAEQELRRRGGEARSRTLKQVKSSAMPPLLSRLWSSPSFLIQNTWKWLLKMTSCHCQVVMQRSSSTTPHCFLHHHSKFC